MENKRILIFGGCGSLGKTLIKKYVSNNTIINFSRDENKHWMLELKFGKKNIINTIGDIYHKDQVKKAIKKYNPNIIIIASAMKHIDRCESEIDSCVNTNMIGIGNIVNCVLEDLETLTNLETVCFISSDKACNPISSYGLCKATGEKYIQYLANELKHTSIKCVSVRYGNVLNSRGSIIEIIKEKISQGQRLFLTDPRMTRYIMTLEQSVDLIEYAIFNGDNGDTVIPRLRGMLIKDLIEIFCEKYGVHYDTGSLRFIEKLHEELINETQSMWAHRNGIYYHIRSPFQSIVNEDLFVMRSDQDCYSRDELREYLESLKFL